MIFGIVDSRPVRRSIISVLNAVIESDTPALPTLSFGALSFEEFTEVVEPPGPTAQIVDIWHGDSYPNGSNQPPGAARYSLGQTMRVRAQFSRAIDLGANEYVVLQNTDYSPDPSTEWTTVTSGFELIEGDPLRFFVSDSRVGTNGVSYQLWENKITYYRVKLMSELGDELEVSEPAEFTFYSNAAGDPGRIRFYFDDLLGDERPFGPGGTLTDRDTDNGYLWEADAVRGPNSYVYNATLGRLVPTATGTEVSANKLRIDAEIALNVMVVRAKLYCDPSTPGLGSGAALVILNNSGAEVCRWDWVGSSVRTITDFQTDTYTVPAGTTSIEMEIQMGTGSFGITNTIFDDNHVAIWNGNGPSINNAIDMTGLTTIVLVGANGPTVDSWDSLKLRGTTSYFDAGQTK